MFDVWRARQGQVGTAPPLEALPLLIDSLEGKVSCLAPKLNGGQVSPLLGSHGLKNL